MIVRNASNKLGEFSCVYITFAYLKMFVCIADKENLDTLLKYLLALENEALANPDWFDNPDKKICMRTTAKLLHPLLWSKTTNRGHYF